MTDEEATRVLIEQAITSPKGHLRLAIAEEFMISELERNRFNTERAIEIYSIAVDNSVWDWLKEMSLRKLLYRNYRQSDLGKVYAAELTQTFKAKFRPPLEDQRPPRRFLRSLLGA
jgi:hypothetical protein